MTNISPSKLVPGVKVCFYPVLGALHIADGVITHRSTKGGQLLLTVQATEGDGAGKTWTIAPEDVIFIRPLASWFNGKL